MRAKKKVSASRACSQMLLSLANYWHGERCSMYQSQRLAVPLTVMPMAPSSDGKEQHGAGSRHQACRNAKAAQQPR